MVPMHLGLIDRPFVPEGRIILKWLRGVMKGIN